jgi:hypothetical protein
MNFLDTRHHITHLTGAQGVFLVTLGSKDTHTIHIMITAGAFQTNAVALGNRTILDPNQGDNPQIGIKPGINNQGLQRTIRLTLRWRNTRHQIFQNILNIQATLG